MPIANEIAFQCRGKVSGSACCSACSSACWPSLARPSYMCVSPEQSPGVGEAALLVGVLEQPDRVLGLVDQPAGRDLGVRDEPHVRTAEAREALDAALARRQRALQRLLVDLSRLRVVGGSLQRLADRGQQLQPPARGRGQQRSGALEQADRRGVLARAHRPPARGGKVIRGALRERERALVDLAQVGAVAVGALEVVAEDRLDLDHAVGVALLQPVGEPLVQLGAVLFGDRLVGRVAHEDVAEGEAGLALEGGWLGRDQLLARESLEHARERRRRRRARSRPPPRTRARRPRPRRSRAARGRSAGRGARPAARGSWAARSRPPRRRVSRRNAIICCRKSGLPSARAVSWSRTASAAASAGRSWRISARVSPSDSGPSSSSEESWVSRPQPGRCSISSWRARQTSISGASAVCSSRCSIRSSSAGSAQCRSSNTSTTGRSRASCREQVPHRAGQVLARRGGLLEPGGLQDAVGEQLGALVAREDALERGARLRARPPAGARSRPAPRT